MSTWQRFELSPKAAGIPAIPRGYVPPKSKSHPVKRTRKGRIETWTDIAQEHQLDVWHLIAFNFPGCRDVSKAPVVNWYLHHYFNCPLAPDRINRMFKPDMHVYYPDTAVAAEPAPAPQGHDAKVTAVINQTIDEVYNDFKGVLTVSEMLEESRARIVKQREKNGLDTTLRDAEYYFIARWLISEQKGEFSKIALSMGGLALTKVYNGLKMVLPDGMIRTDKDNPNSPPGGNEWVDLGSRDALNDNGSAKTKPRRPGSMEALRKKMRTIQRHENRRAFD